MYILTSFLDFIKINIEYNFILTFLVFFIFLLLYNSFSIPGNIIFIASTGYFFGVYIGYLISIITLVLGSLIFFTYSHFLLKKFFPKFIKKKKFRLQNYISKSSIEYLIILRIIPGTPLFFQNLILSFLDITKTNFIISSFIGFTPFVLIVVFFGDHINNYDELKNLSISDFYSFKFLFLIFLIIFLLLLRIFYKK